MKDCVSKSKKKGGTTAFIKLKSYSSIGLKKNAEFNHLPSLLTNTQAANRLLANKKAQSSRE
jgi:hypothetical protein